MSPTESELAIIRQRQAHVDSLPADIRALVHDFGWGVVSAYLQAGVTKAKRIRHLIETTLDGSWEIRSRRLNTQVISRAAERLNKCLSEFHLPANGQALVDSLRRNGAVIVCMQPTTAMVDASIHALHQPQYANAYVTKQEKHRIRLTAALRAAEREQMERPQ